MDNTDWETLARARGLEIEDSELQRVLEPLRDLEKRFRPLVGGIPLALDPAPIFRADAESRE
jgi:hypothetical protein